VKKEIISLIKNKYVFILLGFIVWIGLLDKNNLINTFKNRKKLEKLSEDKEYYNKEIEQTHKLKNDLTTNKRAFEKYVRENFFLKRDDEEIIILEDKAKP